MLLYSETSPCSQSDFCSRDSRKIIIKQKKPPWNLNSDKKKLHFYFNVTPEIRIRLIKHQKLFRFKQDTWKQYLRQSLLKRFDQKLTWWPISIFVKLKVLRWLFAPLTAGSMVSRKSFSINWQIKGHICFTV